MEEWSDGVMDQSCSRETNGLKGVESIAQGASIGLSQIGVGRGRLRPEGPGKLSPGFTLGFWFFSPEALKGRPGSAPRDSNAPSGPDTIEHLSQDKPWAKLPWPVGPGTLTPPTSK